MCIERVKMIKIVDTNLFRVEPVRGSMWSTNNTSLPHSYQPKRKESLLGRNSEK